MLQVKALPLAELRERSSEKWREYPADVLPLFVAETDFPLAPAVSAALQRAVAVGDTGYVASRTPLAESFAAFAARRYGWSPDPARMRSTADVSMGLVEILRRVTQPGERVVVTPPVYPPFYDLVAESGAEVERVPLRDTGIGWELDLAGIRGAFEDGATAMLLCNPHNPTGTVHARESLAALADLAEEFGVAVISDEIHAPLAQPGTGFTPFLAASDAARRVGYAVVSASKAFNLAGLKCALMVTADEETTAVVRGLPVEVEWRTGQFGLLAAVAAFSEESDEWLDGLLRTLDENRVLLEDLLASHLPGARYRIPEAGYLAWIDLSALGWGENPARRILRDAKVALHFGPAFGIEGAGHVRLNFGTSPEILTEAVERIAALVDR
ncbi:aminotransferase class I/II-fold pyridoxal phosphate-dependent enzyme [Microbacterium sp. KSW4-16]|uniref:cysteine-S-conjugate beta-lyase n=1 Tax=Microbacterium aurugineum TaxID=2851642 RepID=A0ABY4IXQ8_9MICO|nr:MULTISPECIES: aminotransferase class I/II-fold pyridoxal phosphate-dependent enzyme [Microbacterium]MCK8465822.1 aminotransferase class I/II-fold pyridoxal phosphate-dependent enzyme [Microbacterium aurugineum]TCJ29101.1 aminotransferase class I/II-fold pyridoxal phosphate-dependent enzyme [Microbacterium sp. PI-1]UPL17551.1 aminotransferase class I/II-fold pyridoxal phosphate-dependent enzyme [Microbacterium aurugineum]